jgi:excisionase family DNA binding protein
MKLHAERTARTRAAHDPLLTVPEAAEHLRFSLRTTRQLIVDGLLPCVRIGGRVRVRPADLVRFVEDRVSAPVETHARSSVSGVEPRWPR